MFSECTRIFNFLSKLTNETIYAYNGDTLYIHVNNRMIKFSIHPSFTHQFRRREIWCEKLSRKKLTIKYHSNVYYKINSISELRKICSLIEYMRSKKIFKEGKGCSDLLTQWKTILRRFISRDSNELYILQETFICNSTPINLIQYIQSRTDEKVYGVLNLVMCLIVKYIQYIALSVKKNNVAYFSMNLNYGDIIVIDDVPYLHNVFPYSGYVQPVRESIQGKKFCKFLADTRVSKNGLTSVCTGLMLTMYLNSYKILGSCFDIDHDCFFKKINNYITLYLKTQKEDVRKVLENASGFILSPKNTYNFLYCILKNTNTHCINKKLFISKTMPFLTSSTPYNHSLWLFCIVAHYSTCRMFNDDLPVWSSFLLSKEFYNMYFSKRLMLRQKRYVLRYPLRKVAENFYFFNTFTPDLSSKKRQPFYERKIHL